jgi:hemolysin activation/secretion protein
MSQIFQGIFMDRHLFYFLGLLSIGTVVHGSAHAQIAPDAGQVLRETRPAFPVPPNTNGQGVRVDVPASEPATSQQSQSFFTVQSLKIEGSKAFPTEVLHALVADAEGSTRTLTEWQRVVARITAHYRQAGYLVARAYLPAQKLDAGMLTIAVLEGQLADVQLDNASRLSAERATAWLAGVPLGQPLQRDAVDRAVLLLSDVPGVGATDSRVAAGKEVGDSVLHVSLADEPVWSGRLEADNHGGLYTGRNRVGGNVSLNSPWGYGERLTARLLASDGDLVSGRLGGQVPLGTDGLTLGAGLGRTTYQLGNSFASLDAVGRTDTTELTLRYPWLRSVAANVYVQLGQEWRKLRDEVRSTATVTDKTARVTTLSLQAEGRDGWGGGGNTQASLRSSTPFFRNASLRSPVCQ